MCYETHGDSLIGQLGNWPHPLSRLPCPLHLGQAKLYLAPTRYLGGFPGPTRRNPSKKAQEQCPQRFFASYSREDHAQVFLIVDKLRERGLNIWIDQEGIHGAKLWSQE